MPRVSIIMNVLNGEAYLREAMNSVAAQTYTDWELIVWDDRSTDDSARIVAEHRAKPVRYFLSAESTPLGKARDLAMAHVSGEWLAFLDQDDIWLPDKLEKQMSLVDTEPGVGLVYGRTMLFTPRGGERDFDHKHEFQPLPEGDIFERLFTKSCFISMSSAMLRRESLDEIGRIPDTIEIIPDYYMFTAVARQHPARAVQDVICRYRWHSGGLSHSSQRRMHEEVLWLIDRWAVDLDPGIVTRRRKIHNTVLAWAEMRNPPTFARGLTRLFTKGSVGFLLSRPFARTHRAIRRRVRRPICKNRP